MDVKKNRTITFGFILLVFVLLLAACASRPIPLQHSFSLMFDNSMFFTGTFTDSVQGFTMTCEDPSQGISRTIFDHVDVNKNTFISVGGPLQWPWGPGQKVTLSADGYATEVITLPDYGTADWDQFLAQARYGSAPQVDSANSGSNSSFSQSNSGSSAGSQLLCQNARNNYDHCIEDSSYSDDPVYQTNWATTCENAKEAMERVCGGY